MAQLAFLAINQLGIYPEEVTLNHVAWAIKNDKNLLTNENANIFYVKDKNDICHAVFVRWDGFGWRVYAYPVGSSVPWGGGYRVFSRNFETSVFFDTSLENRVKQLEEDIKKLRKVVNF